MNKKLRIALTAAGCIVLALAAFTVSLYGRYMTPPARIVFLSPSTQAGNIYADGVTTERDNMNAIADLIGQHLPDDFTVLRNDPNLTVKEAVDASNAAGSGIHVALHSNAAGTDAVVRGCEVYIRMRDYPSRRLAACVYSAVSAVTPTGDRGIKYSSTLYEVTKTKAPCVLVELDFHDNPGGSAFLTENRDALAQAVADGIIAYYNKPVDFLSLLKSFVGM